MGKITNSSRRWLKRHQADPYVLAARKRGLRSRANIKLEQMQQRDQFIQSGMYVLDLGAAPGGWSQLLVQWVGQKGSVVACDLLPIKPLSHVQVIQGIFLLPAVQDQIKTTQSDRLFDVVVSDIAPNFQGHAKSDQLKSAGIISALINTLPTFLKLEGDCLLKVFQGPGFEDLLTDLKHAFKKVQVRKPQASRKES